MVGGNGGARRQARRNLRSSDDLLRSSPRSPDAGLSGNVHWPNAAFARIQASRTVRGRARAGGRRRQFRLRHRGRCLARRDLRGLEHARGLLHPAQDHLGPADRPALCAGAKRLVTLRAALCVRSSLESDHQPRDRAVAEIRAADPEGQSDLDASDPQYRHPRGAARRRGARASGNRALRRQDRAFQRRLIRSIRHHHLGDGLSHRLSVPGGCGDGTGFRQRAAALSHHDASADREPVLHRPVPADRLHLAAGRSSGADRGAADQGRAETASRCRCTRRGRDAQAARAGSVPRRAIWSRSTTTISAARCCASSAIARYPRPSAFRSPRRCSRATPISHCYVRRDRALRCGFRGRSR